MIKYLIFIIMAECLIACGEGRQLPAPAYYENPGPIDTSKLRLNGFYTISDPRYPRDKYSAMHPLFFTRDNRVYFSHGGNIRTDSSMFTGRYYKNLDSTDLGVYIIEGNQITAYLPVAVWRGAFYGIYKLNFAGTIVTKDSITNWRAVPPFPKKVKQSIIEDNNGLFVGHDYTFVQADSIRSLKRR